MPATVATGTIAFAVATVGSGDEGSNYAMMSNPSTSTPTHSNGGGNSRQRHPNTHSNKTNNNKKYSFKENTNTSSAPNNVSSFVGMPSFLSQENNSENSNTNNNNLLNVELYQTLSDKLPFDNITITAYIPTVSVGACIGKRGTTIAKIQKWAQQLAGTHSDQVRISVVHHPTTTSPSTQNATSTSPSLAAVAATAAASTASVSNEDNGKKGTPLVSSTTSPSTPAVSSHSSGTATSATTATVVPSTYTELDFSDPQWTPVVIRAPTMSGLVVSATLLEICLEYVVDRTHIVFIMDLPISSQTTQQQSNNGTDKNGTPNNTTSIISNAHATIIGKRGQTIMALSANSNCRIMVPPKALKHDVVQLEGPLQECTTCLEGIANLLSSTDGAFATNTTLGATTPKKSSGSNLPTTPNHNKSNATSHTTTTTTTTSTTTTTTTTNKNAQIRSNDNKHTCAFVVRPLPSQTKLRNIARRTETVIRKTRRTKTEFTHLSPSVVAATALRVKRNNTEQNEKEEEHNNIIMKPTTAITEHHQEETAVSPAIATSDAVAVAAGGVAATADTTTTTSTISSDDVPWKLTICGSNPKQVYLAWQKLIPFKIADVPEETNISLSKFNNTNTNNNSMDPNEDSQYHDEEEQEDDDDDDEEDEEPSETDHDASIADISEHSESGGNGASSKPRASKLYNSSSSSYSLSKRRTKHSDKRANDWKSRGNVVG